MTILKIWSGPSATITNATGNGSVITFTANNIFLSDDSIAVTGVNPSGYNANYDILFANSTVFEVAGTTTSAYVAGGTATSWFAPSRWNLPKIWNGSTWQLAKPRYWTGTGWSDQLTTGVYVFIASGGKGTAAHSLYTYGFTPGSGTYGNYQDYENFYSIAYNAIGSFETQVLIGGSFRTVSELVWFNFSSEDSSTGYNEYRLRIRIAANLGGTAYTPYIDGVPITSTSKVGTWDGTNTVYEWLTGTLPNSGGSSIPGSDAGTPLTNPFGNDGTNHTFAML